jgi:hypothetical protein
MKIFNRLNTALDSGISKAIFDHLRNFLICAFLLAVGTNELKEHTSSFLGLIPTKFSGIGVIAIAISLIALNLYDGIRKISKTKHHLILTFVLIFLYIFFAIRVVQMTWDFRLPF